LPPPPPPSSLLWDASDALFGPIDDDLLLGSDDLHLPARPAQFLLCTSQKPFRAFR
jgi:hypothetical protein